MFLFKKINDINLLAGTKAALLELCKTVKADLWNHLKWIIIDHHVSCS